MATETILSDHPTAPEQPEKEVLEEVKTMEEECVPPLKVNKVKPKEDSSNPVVSSAETVEKMETESELSHAIGQTNKGDKEEKPTTEEPPTVGEEAMKSDEDEKPRAEQLLPPPPTTTKEVNKQVETLALDVVREDVAELKEEPIPEMGTQGIQEKAVDVVKGETETENVEIQAEKEPEDQPTTVDILKTSVEADDDKEEKVAELHANEPEKSEVSEPVAIEEDKLAEQPEVTENFELAETKTEEVEAPVDNIEEKPAVDEMEKELAPEAHVAEAPPKEDVEKIEESTDSENVKTDVVAEELDLPEAKEAEKSKPAEKAAEVDTASRDIDLIAEHGSKKDETKVSPENNGATEVKEKLDEATATATELSVEEPQKPETETKEEETVTAVESKLEQEKERDETAKTDAPKDSEGKRTTLQEAFKEEVPAKTKQPNNLISKMKHSLVKAKKAIIGKSPNSKSETKDEVTAK